MTKILLSFNVTASLKTLPSPANAARLHGAIDRAKKRDLEGYPNQEADDPAQSIAELCEELGIVREKK
jgi:hypothetical protein